MAWAFCVVVVVLLVVVVVVVVDGNLASCGQAAFCPFWFRF